MTGGRRAFSAGVVAALVTLVASSASAQMSVDARLADDQPPVIAAWRGTSGGFPEFSLAGIENSLSIGVALIDLHVQLTADGRHIVFHDGFLNSATDVESAFPEGHPGGPTRAARGGRDYVDDYALDEIRTLRLVLDGEATPNGVATLEEALDVIGGNALVLLSLQRFDMDGLAAILAPREKDNLLVYSQDPYVIRDVIAATGIDGFASLRRTRVFDTDDALAILNASSEVIGADLAVAHIDSANRLTPELLNRAGELGIRLSVSGIGKEDYALGERGDGSVWRETLESGASIFWTTYPSEVLKLLPE